MHVAILKSPAAVERDDWLNHAIVASCQSNGWTYTYISGNTDWSLSKNIRAAGLALELSGDEMLAIVWNALSWASLMVPRRDRPDEITFDSIAADRPVGWAAGHRNAIIRWAATCYHSDELHFEPWPQNRCVADKQAGLVWWAQRMNLKVYMV